MSQEQKREAFVVGLLETYKDGLQLKDAVATVDLVLRYVGEYGGPDALEKKAEVKAIVHELLEEFDPPGPDFVWGWVVDELIDAVADHFFSRGPRSGNAGP